MAVNEFIVRLCGEVVRAQFPEPVCLSLAAGSTTTNYVAVGRSFNLSVHTEKGNSNTPHRVLVTNAGINTYQMLLTITQQRLNERPLCAWTRGSEYR